MNKIILQTAVTEFRCVQFFCLTCSMELSKRSRSDPESSKNSLNFAQFAFNPSSSKAAPNNRLLLGDLDEPVKVASTSHKRALTEEKTSLACKKSKGTLAQVKDVRLPDCLKNDLDILFVGFNPGLNSASQGHHYAGPGNHFWKCLYLSGLVPESLTFLDDTRINDFNIGLTNIVSRPSKTSSDLSKSELKEGALELQRKIVQFRPKIVVFNGMGIYEAFAERKDFCLGKQPHPLPGTETLLYVMPSSSPRGTKWPRMEDKLQFYHGVAHLRDFVHRKVAELDMAKVTFSK